jgi:hypothetical protein
LRQFCTLKSSLRRWGFVPHSKLRHQPNRRD